MTKHKEEEGEPGLLARVQEAASRETFSGKNWAAVYEHKKEIRAVLARGYSVRLTWMTLKTDGKIDMSCDRFRVICDAMGLRKAKKRDGQQASKKVAPRRASPARVREGAESGASSRPKRAEDGRAERPPERSDHDVASGFLHPAKVKKEDVY